MDNIKEWTATSVTALIVTALSVTALSVTALIVTALSVTALSATALSVTALSVTALSATALIVTALSVTALSVTALSVTESLGATRAWVEWRNIVRETYETDVMPQRQPLSRVRRRTHLMRKKMRREMNNGGASIRPLQYKLVTC